jgi:hypothetical protein
VRRGDVPARLDRAREIVDALGLGHYRPRLDALLAGVEGRSATQ